ncbi:MAG TPA: nuclear transport factor 2 family protein [Beijerinckiaceae bacterium]|nr:nuclear transport factor 2 family protein [Beijerinckiaceae bacterium]
MDIRVEDRLSINDLLMKYVWASDTGDVDAFIDTFLPDGMIGRTSGERYERRAGIRRFAEESISPPGNRGRMHFFQTISVEPEARGYRVFSFWQVVQVTARAGGKVRSTGTTSDLCVKVDGRFRFKERIIGRWNDETAPWKYDVASPSLPV